jgi:Cu/Ag efflux pump CusA
VAVLFVLAIFILSRMGGEFIPSLEEGDFAVDTRVLPGSNLTTTIESTQKAAHILKSRFPEVKSGYKNRKWGSSYRPDADGCFGYDGYSER